MNQDRALAYAAFAVLSLGIFAGCSSGTASESPTARGAFGLTNLAGACDGQVSCVAGSAPATTVTLHRDASGAGCVVQGSTLLAGGAVDGHADGSWTGDAESLRVCQGASCFTCTKSDGVADVDAGMGTAPKKKSCHGYASCPSYPPCANVRGCILHTHYDYDGSGNVSGTDDSCEGSAESCEDEATSASCESQGLPLGVSARADRAQMLLRRRLVQRHRRDRSHMRCQIATLRSHRGRW